MHCCATYMREIPIDLRPRFSLFGQSGLVSASCAAYGVAASIWAINRSHRLLFGRALKVGVSLDCMGIVTVVTEL